MKPWTTLLALTLAAAPLSGALASEETEAPDPNVVVEPGLFEKMKYRLLGPFRGGRSTVVAGVRGAFVDNIQTLRRKDLGEAVADQGNTIDFHQGSTFLKGFTTTWPYTPALT